MTSQAKKRRLTATTASGPMRRAGNTRGFLIMRSTLLFSATSLGAAVLFGAHMLVPTAAHADFFNFTSDDCTNGCGANGQGSTNNNFGSVNVTSAGTGALDFLVTLNSPLNFLG